MKLVSWNVNGIRSALDKGLRAFVESDLPDVLCLQETKAEAGQADLSWAGSLGYAAHWCSAEKKGYSGTAILSRVPPESVSPGMDVPEHDREGRILTATFPGFHLVNVYTPNSQRGLTRLEYRQRWDLDFLAFLVRLRQSRPVIFCGDLNCAHREIDLANPKQNRRNAGFTDEEREGLSRILDSGFRDVFREREPGPGHYTWWTFRSNARERNIGWRIDYFMVDERLADRVVSASIRPEIPGSDHCPVQLELR
jgi:exodeoxyribonuclease-3